MSYKALAISRNIASILSKRITLAISEGFDAADQNPWVLVGTGATTTEGALIKLKAIDLPLAKNIVGLASEVFTPHVCQVVVEAHAAGNTELGYSTWANLLPILADVVNQGAKVEVYVVANGKNLVSDVLADSANYIKAANLKATYENAGSNAMYPSMASQ